MKNKQPKLSVIIPTFNQDVYIGRCLRSLLLQTINHKDYEIIVINDGSTDKTAYALSLFSNPDHSTIRVINNKKNIGLPASLNLGIKNSLSEYIVRVDSDDYVNKNFLNFLLLYIQTNKECSAVACDYLLVDDKENEISRENCILNPIGCGILFRKETMIKAGLYDEKFKLHEDSEFRLRYEKNNNIERLKIPLYRYRRHKSNITNNTRKMRLYQNKLERKHELSVRFE